MHKKKITKRQRKAMTHRNAMSAYSMKHGGRYEVAGTAYQGLSKLFDRGQCVRPGIPFVRVFKKRAYVYGA